ncbi:MAG: hypothetical protein KZQ99_11075 [Candidatus Thiodiazotropha sp. (ex Dulcina madagascariensis)]|nr:hypothetical protein [Candidatus Thiodiazotropha sp. (ex Dulcina madagascariensis)]
MITNSIGTVTLKSGPLYLCDMRYGPTEDGYVFEAERGEYQVIQQAGLDGGNRIQVIKSDMLPDRDQLFGKLSTELNLFGVFDLGILLDEFKTIESLYEWGEDEAYRNIASAWFTITSPRGSKIHCFRVGENEQECTVNTLYKGDRLIGFEVLVASDDEILLSGSTASIYRVNLIYKAITLEFFVFAEYDQESVDDTIRDCVLDYLSDDENIRLDQIIHKNEPEIYEETLLGEIDLRLSSLQGLKVYLQDSSSSEKMILDVSDAVQLPRNNIKAIRDTIQKFAMRIDQ